MSANVFGAVFERYRNGGGELLLALALADHAHDDGTHIFPYVETFAIKTRQSVRAVQYQLKTMREVGWLITVNSGNGGRSQASEYRISPEWLAGGEAIAPAKQDEKSASEKISPFSDGAEKGAAFRQSITFGIAYQVTPGSGSGAIERDKVEEVPADREPGNWKLRGRGHPRFSTALPCDSASAEKRVSASAASQRLPKPSAKCIAIVVVKKVRSHSVTHTATGQS